jgi:hypothetical protein
MFPNTALEKLIGKAGSFTEDELNSLRGLCSGVAQLPNNFATAIHVRTAVETIDAIRRFDEASGRLVQTTNHLTKKGLWLSAAAIAIACASLGVSIFALLK